MAETSWQLPKTQCGYSFLKPLANDIATLWGYGYKTLKIGDVQTAEATAFALAVGIAEVTRVLEAIIEGDC